MKLLILSSNNGGGHNSTAAAIREYYESQGFEVIVRDCLSFLSENVSELISMSHIMIYRHLPWLTDDTHTKIHVTNTMFEENHPVRQFIDLGKFSLRKFIHEEQFDTIICTHVFGGMMLSAALQDEDRKIRTAIVETDYCNTPGSASNTMDFHFLPDESLKEELIHNGVSEEQIVISGIPVKKRVIHHMDPKAAKKLYGVPLDHAHIILMGGSMGCGPIPKLLDILSDRLSDTADISLVCGNNTHLEKETRELYASRKNVHIFGYTPDMSVLYASADLFVTKPGGISTTEAAVLGLPMVLVQAVAGWETYNLNFFIDRNAAVTGETEEELVDCCEYLLRNDEARKQISENLLKLAHPDSAEIIYRTLETDSRE